MVTLIALAAEVEVGVGSARGKVEEVSTKWEAVAVDLDRVKEEVTAEVVTTRVALVDEVAWPEVKVKMGLGDRVKVREDGEGVVEVVAGAMVKAGSNRESNEL